MLKPRLQDTLIVTDGINITAKDKVNMKTFYGIGVYKTFFLHFK
jgi:hypothetical protein